MKKAKFIISLVRLGIDGAIAEGIYDSIHDTINLIDPSQLEQVVLCIAQVIFKGKVDREDILFMQQRMGPYYTAMIGFQIALWLNKV